MSAEQDQAKSTKATDLTDAELSALVAKRRTDLGIAPPKDPQRPKLPEVPLPPTPEEIARMEAWRESSLRREEMERIGGEMRKLVERAGHRYAECSLENFKTEHSRQQRILTSLREYVSELSVRLATREGLLLYGPVGTGKDHLAMAVCRLAVKERFSVGWVNGQDWFGDLRDLMDTEKRTERQEIHSLCYPSILVVSDPLPPFGGLGQHMATMLYRLIGERYATNKPTIVTVNVASDEEAIERMGAPTWDRMGHGAWKLFCNWPSYRKPARIVN